MNIYMRLSLLLFLFCGVSAGALAVANNATYARIKENEEGKERILRGKAIAGEQQGQQVTFDAAPVEIGGKRYYVGRLDGKSAGTAFTTVTNKGYGGPIEIIVAMDGAGEKISGVRIKSHTETPGLGANAAQIRYGEIEPWFLLQFKGLRPEEVKLKKDDPKGAIDAITAATITSRAVTNAIREEATAFQKAWPELKETVPNE
ncbi:MAG: RnfABCDGE type electron transport complex subunit G [Candidatus Lindowbacteria bacterium]|nr:RnfABCDGE type electron transport complex subunit G [Candidatus Lindowbacteria bacterium]